MQANHPVWASVSSSVKLGNTTSSKGKVQIHEFSAKQPDQGLALGTQDLLALEVRPHWGLQEPHIPLGYPVTNQEQGASSKGSL